MITFPNYTSIVSINYVVCCFLAGVSSGSYLPKYPYLTSKNEIVIDIFSNWSRENHVTLSHQSFWSLLRLENLEVHNSPLLILKTKFIQAHTHSLKLHYTPYFKVCSWELSRHLRYFLLCQSLPEDRILYIQINIQSYAFSSFKSSSLSLAIFLFLYLYLFFLLLFFFCITFGLWSYHLLGVRSGVQHAAILYHSSAPHYLYSWMSFSFWFLFLPPIFSILQKTVAEPCASVKGS